MTTSTEQRGFPSNSERPFGEAWRQAVERAQGDALPVGSVAVSCSAPVGVGGLGRHLQEIAASAERGERPLRLLSGADSSAMSGAADTHGRRTGARWSLRAPAALLAGLPGPLSPGVRTWAFMRDFDARAARELPRAEQLIAFNGQALAQLRAARRLGYDGVSLVSANSHIRQVARQHAAARRRYPLEGSWTTHLIERNLREYAQADRIYVASSYTRESFLAEGYPEERLVDFPLTPDPRYTHGETDPSGGEFEVVYVGSLAVHKGVPLLIDAIRALPHADLRLRLVGGFGTRGMRRFVEAACVSDPRIRMSPGDPLPAFRSARLCVHPAYEDGFAYAPAEALASGLPVIVSADTGMKDLLGEANPGLVVPTGDLGALSEAIDAAYRGEILSRG